MGFGTKRGLSILLALVMAMSFGLAANCVNPCVDTSRALACKVISTQGNDAQTAPDKCCPTSGPYGGTSTGMYGIPCPADRNDCLANYWQVPDSVCDPPGCCFAYENYMQYACIPQSIAPVTCEGMGGTFGETCDEIPDCAMGCCIYMGTDGNLKGTITYDLNCTRNFLYGEFEADETTVDGCNELAETYSSGQGGVTGNVEPWEVTIDRGDGVYVSSRLLCFEDSRGDSRLVDEQTSYFDCPFISVQCPDYDEWGTGRITCNSTCNVSSAWNINWNDPANLRYEGLSVSEGGCRIAALTVHQASNVPIVGDTLDEVIWAQPEEEESGPDLKPISRFVKLVSWDMYQEQCELIGADWLTDAEASSMGVSGTGFDRSRCCGDDWIWINNRAKNYDPGITTASFLARKNAGTLCLYDTESFTQSVSGGNVLNYTCERPQEEQDHISYDLTLEYDDEGDEQAFPNPQMGYYFPSMTGTDEVDVGKWHGSGNNYLYCNYYFDNTDGHGDMFRWMTLAEGGELGPIECELHLGFNWTGTRCCGNNPGETFNDIAKECDAKTIANYIINSQPYTSRGFITEFKSSCNAQQTRNGACWQAHFIPDRTALPADFSNPGKVNILTINGTLNGCKDRNGNSPITDSSLLSTGSTNYDKCAYVAENVCAYLNDSWIRKDTSSSSIAYTLLGYTGTDTVKESSLPSNPSSKECCFSGSCWNGSKCVPHGKVYLLESGIFTEFPETDWRDYEGKEIYACQNSTWTRSEPKFNWYRDPTQINFCQQPYSCMCAGAQTNPYDYSCDSQYVDSNNCLKQPNVYKEDHYCQAMYSGSTVISSKWTTRTKLLAEQMTALAGGSDYTLFCDKYSRSVNYPVPLEMIEGNINSVCTIYYGDTSAIGISLRPTSGDSMLFDVKPILYDPGNGLIDQVLGESETVPTCSNAIQSSNDAEHGTFKRCTSSSNKVWYNNRTRSIIYSKNGLSYSDSLPVPDWNSADSQLMDMAQPILDHAQANKELIESGTNAKPGIGMIQFTSDFNRLYAAKRGSRSVLGFAETKYDSEFTEDLRNVLGVAYNGFSNIDCEDIIHAYPESYCGVQDGEIIVLDKGPGDFELWQDLTSKVRIS
jgi:hypothetical protein